MLRLVPTSYSEIDFWMSCSNCLYNRVFWLRRVINACLSLSDDGLTTDENISSKID